MSVETGLSWKLAIDTTGTPTYTDFPNQTTCDVEYPRNDAAVNHKDNSGWEDYITISRGLTISCSGFVDEDNAAITYLVDTEMLGSTTDVTETVQLTNTDGDTLVADVSIESFSIEAPFDAPATYTVSFKGRGEPTLTRAT